MNENILYLENQEKRWIRDGKREKQSKRSLPEEEKRLEMKFVLLAIINVSQGRVVLRLQMVIMALYDKI